MSQIKSIIRPWLEMCSNCKGILERGYQPCNFICFAESCIGKQFGKLLWIWRNDWCWLPEYATPLWTRSIRLFSSPLWNLTSHATRRIESNMRRSISFEKFIVLALFCYFGFILLRAHNKLRDRKIGTVFQTISVKTVQESYRKVFLFWSNRFWQIIFRCIWYLLINR